MGWVDAMLRAAPGAGLRDEVGDVDAELRAVLRVGLPRAKPAGPEHLLLFLLQRPPWPCPGASAWQWWSVVQASSVSPELWSPRGSIVSSPWALRPAGDCCRESLEWARQQGWNHTALLMLAEVP